MVPALMYSVPITMLYKTAFRKGRQESWMAYLRNGYRLEADGEKFCGHICLDKVRSKYSNQRT